jgi:hypothetical protein
MPFVKGDPRINRAGKKPGTQDKKWQNIQAIWDLFMKEYPNLKASERATHMLTIFRLHFDRAIAQLPKDQSDSVMNANKMMEQLKELEAQTLEQFKSRTGKTSVADGKAEVQVKPSTTGS